MREVEPGLESAESVPRLRAALSESQGALARQRADAAEREIRWRLVHAEHRARIGDLEARLRAVQEEREARLRAVQENLDASFQRVESLEAGQSSLEEERNLLREQRDLLLRERNDLARRLDEMEATLALRLVRRFWALMRLWFPEGSRRRVFYGKARALLGRRAGAVPAGAGPAEAAPAGVEAPDFRGDLLRFEETVHASGSRRVVAILSATQLLESEGQRPTQLALELARRGTPVVFAYWRWWKGEWCPQDRLAEGIVQVPVDLLSERPDLLLGAFVGLQKLLFIEFPHPSFFELIAAATPEGWTTVYDVLDDWEEFHRVGQAVWYEEAFERHVITSADAVFAINDVLADRIRALGGDRVEVVGNGLKPGLERVHAEVPLERGEITVGYFGYLAGAWFDWPLVAAAAARRPAWRFYLIGYGGSPEGIELPGNVELLGKKPQRELAAHAANWDVAIIPFKPDRLAAGADPIKTYEYLAMGLPAVVTGVHPPRGGEDLVLRAEGVDDFLAKISDAAARPERELAARRAFAASCTWGHRLEAILDSVEQGRQRTGEKRALLGLGS